MQNETIQLLNQLNRDFYDAFAVAFAESRGPSEPGLERVLAEVMPGSHVLDLGCGQGRVLHRLPAGCAYVGLDFSRELLAVAAARAAEAGRVARFIVADLLDPGWPAQAGGLYDWIVLRAVLQHIPGAEHRRRVVQQAAALLAPAGTLVLANWQFLEVERLRRRILPWAELGLTEADVEPGDYLLDWRREGQGRRYVHWVDEDETRALAAAAGLTVAALFHADGHENRLTLYALLKIAS